MTITVNDRRVDDNKREIVFVDGMKIMIDNVWSIKIK